MFKLRTMVEDAESRLDELIDLDALGRTRIQDSERSRITRVGAVLAPNKRGRGSGFINVLIGSMSPCWAAPRGRGSGRALRQAAATTTLHEAPA